VDGCRASLGPLDAKWLLDRLDVRVAELEATMARMNTPLAYTKDGVPVRVGMTLYRVVKGRMQSGCAFFMVDLGNVYWDVTAAYSSKQAAMEADQA
jgi:hypothetical protein